MTTILLANPTAGRGQGGRVATATLAAARSAWPAVELQLTRGPGHAAELAAGAARAGAERLIVIGGDGTVHEAANGLLDGGAECPLGVVPIGTGNDFSRQLGTAGLRPARAVAALAAAPVRRFDALRVGGEWVINSCGVGFAAATAIRANGYRRLRGTAAYVAAVARTILDLEPFALECRWDGGTFDGSALLLEVGNGSTTGGGFRLVPGARPDDGALDFCLIEAMPVAAILRRLPAILRARHQSSDGITVGRSTAITLHAPGLETLPIHLDGEVRHLAPATVTIAVRAACLPVLDARGRT